MEGSYIVKIAGGRERRSIIRGGNEKNIGEQRAEVRQGITSPKKIGHFRS